MESDFDGIQDHNPTNLARALRFLAKLGLLTFKPDSNPLTASEKDKAKRVEDRRQGVWGQ